jgi:2-oxoglutarate ferredoxin oxidoreductase subunit gamma
MTKRHEIRLCGFGGQGIMLAGYSIGQAASIFQGEYAVLIQDYGPEARGGACRADVVISDEPVLYPYITAPSILIAMSQDGYDKYHSENYHDASVIVDEDLVKARHTRNEKVMAIPARRIAKEIGRVAVANMVIVGFFTAVTGITSLEAMKESLLISVPKGTEQINLKALELGYNYGIEHGRKV